MIYTVYGLSRLAGTRAPIRSQRWPCRHRPPPDRRLLHAQARDRALPSRPSPPSNHPSRAHQPAASSSALSGLHRRYRRACGLPSDWPSSSSRPGAAWRAAAEALPGQCRHLLIARLRQPAASCAPPTCSQRLAARPAPWGRPLSKWSGLGSAPQPAESVHTLCLLLDEGRRHSSKEILPSISTDWVMTVGVPSEVLPTMLTSNFGFRNKAPSYLKLT